MMPAKGSSHATLQEKFLGLTVEPFAALSRAFARSVFASCVPVPIYIYF